MNFKPIEIDKATTFICTAQVSDEAVRQAIDVYNIMVPHPGRIQTGVDRTKKDSLDITLVPNHSLLLQKEVENIRDAYFEYYSLHEFVPKLGMTEHFNIQKYPLNGAYHKIHADRGFWGEHQVRELVWMTYLNDVHSGGETEFIYQRLKIKPQKGLTVMWPAGWTHIHRGLPSPTTEKLIATGWFSPLS